MSSQNPLQADPECAQFAQLLMKQSQEENFGFTKRQVRNITASDRGRSLWKTVNENCFTVKAGKRKFDFGLLCRELCQPEFSSVRKCFKMAKNDYPDHDPREVCMREVWDPCKQIEFTWTDLTMRAVSS